MFWKIICQFMLQKREKCAKTGFFECWVLSHLFHSHFHQEALQFFFTFCLQGGVICIVRLLIFLLAILSPACASSSMAFCMMYSEYKLDKQGDNIQPWQTPVPTWNQSVVPCSLLTFASWPAYRFLRRQGRLSGIPISFRIFHCDPHSQRLWHSQ